MPISEVYNEDCMVGMARYPDKFFDLAIVDPPYGVGASAFGSYSDRKGEATRFTTYKKKNWDNAVPGPEYFDILFKKSKNQIIWGGNHFSLPTSKRWIVWDKMQPDFGSYSMFELAWQSDPKQRAMIFRMSASYNNGGNGSDSREMLAKARIHPTQKPVALYKWLLHKYAQPGNKILDTHMGSQSSRIAAYQMGFDYWGWEIDREYYEAGNKRFIEQTAQLKLL